MKRQMNDTQFIAPTSNNPKVQLANPVAKTITVVPVADPYTKIRRDDASVKSLVNMTLRNYLGAYNSQANCMAAQHRNVIQDKGVKQKIQQIASQGPPPPPLGANIPTPRLKSEIGERRHEPPPCVQNAMMTKDKKPFTYTPGGIDLSEIKSPRMARRIERNANAPGVGELPQSPQPSSQNRPLPPSALAAMQPALPVQVFPFGAPAPPQPPVNAPPPPPMQPLPTKAVATTDGVFERPDMTRIIPQNPMALLRKTPKVERKTFLDELNDMERKNVQPPSQQQYQQPAPMQQQQQHKVSTPQFRHSPPQGSPQAVPQSPQFKSVQYTRQPSYTTQPQPYSVQPQYSTPQMAARAIEINAPPSPPSKRSNVSIGSLYILPTNQQQQLQCQEHQVSVQYSPTPVSQPTPPQRQPQTPPTPQSPIPKLNTAPKPWQNQQRKEPELPEWAQRSQQSPPKEEHMQPARAFQQPPYVTPVKMQQTRPGVEVVWVTEPEVYQHPGHGPAPNRVVPNGQQPLPQVRKQPQQQQLQQSQYQQQEQQQQYSQQDMKGTRIIPIQIEGQNAGPSTPSTSDRRFNRQQSWTPNQSNSFKVIQKMMNTGGTDDNINQSNIEYPPRTAQDYPPSEQMRKVHINDNDREFMNRVEQDIRTNPRNQPPHSHHRRHIPSRTFQYLDESGIDQDVYLYNEPDSRYRGSTIPSKAFKILQHITANEHIQYTSPTSFPTSAPQGQAPGPHVHQIPIHIEGDSNPNQMYVHPSQQTVGEPKKYMGSTIPSRAFRMVQAMTSNSPAAGNIDTQSNEITDKNDLCEINEPPLAPPACPLIPKWIDPYWYDYYSYNYLNCAHPRELADTIHTDRGVASWASYYVDEPAPMKEGDSSSDCSSCRNTPVPYLTFYSGSYNQHCKPNSIKMVSVVPSNKNWDPYYPHYVPPLPHPAYGGSFYFPLILNASASAGESNEAAISVLQKSHKENDTYNIVDDATATKNKNKDSSDSQLDQTIVDDYYHGDNADDADSESSSDDDEDEEIRKRSGTNILPLDKELYSKNDLGSKNPIHTLVTCPRDEENKGKEPEHVLSQLGNNEEDENHVDVSSICVVEDKMPHVLSVIYEESECSFGSKLKRTSSVASTFSQHTIVDESGCVSDEDEDAENENEVVSEILSLSVSEESSGSNDAVKCNKNIEDNIEEEEIDFWSQINKGEDEFPRRQVFYNKYRDSMYSMNAENHLQEANASEQTSETRSKIEEANASSHTEVQNIKTTESFSSFKDNENHMHNKIMNKQETETLTMHLETLDDEQTAWVGMIFKINEHQILSQKINNVEVTVDITNKSHNDQSVSYGIKINDGQIEKFKVDERHISNIVVMKEEIRETLEPPCLELKLNETVENQNEIDEKGINESLNQSKYTPNIQLFNNSKSNNEADIKKTDVCSACFSNKSCSRSIQEEAIVSLVETNEDTADNDVNNLNNNNQEFYVPTIKERIRALQNASRNSISVKKSLNESSLVQLSTIDKDFLAPESGASKSPRHSTKSSVKSLEDNSEDDIDSGVISDVSRHISDTESENVNDIRKTIKYQRAATHSRLYKLLQDECDEEDEADENAERTYAKDMFSLSLQRASRESDFSSPSSSSNEHQVNNLVSTLRKNKNIELKNVPIKVLQAAAAKVLLKDRDATQEDGNQLGGATVAHTPQKFNEYSQYYATWDATVQNQSVGIPSKSFRNLHALSNDCVTQTTFSARCPRTPSSSAS